jgi:hypothetical protein
MVTGEVLSEEQMVSLFGTGRHPNAAALKATPHRRRRRVH